MDDTQNSTQNTEQRTEDGVGDGNTDVNVARENLKAVLQIGLTVQMVSVIVAFAIKKGKEDFLKKLNGLLLEFNGGLSVDEKKELQEDTNRMIETKAEELVESLGETLSEDELKQAVDEMKQIAQSQGSSV